VVIFSAITVKKTLKKACFKALKKITPMFLTIGV